MATTMYSLSPKIGWRDGDRRDGSDESVARDVAHGVAKIINETFGIPVIMASEEDAVQALALITVMAKEADKPELADAAQGPMIKITFEVVERSN